MIYAASVAHRYVFGIWPTNFSIPDAVSKNHSALVSAAQYPSIV